MKFVQTFWIDAGKNGLEAPFGWCSAKYHLMSWALSCLQLNKFHSNVELITDTKGKELLIDQLKLPYKNVRIELDNLDFDADPRLWVMKKMYSYTLHDEPFLNVDGDVYIFKSFPKTLLSGDLIAQNIEQDYDYYKELVNLVDNNFEYIPSVMKTLNISSEPIKGCNAGILGGNNFQFFSGYYDLVQRLVTENKNEINKLTATQMVNFNAIVEQYIFYCLSNDREIKVNYLFDTVYDPAFEGFANFHYLPNNTPFIHALGDYKKNGWVCDQLANRLRIDYPEYYDRIMKLFEDQANSSSAVDSIGLGSKYSNFTRMFLEKSDEEKFYRTKQIIASICDQEQLELDPRKLTIVQSLAYLKQNMSNSNLIALLTDVFEFEKEKFRIIQSLPSDDLIWENGVEAIDRANHVFQSENYLENMELRLSPFCMTVESEWDWACNLTLFTRVKMNNIQNNFHQLPHYYQTLLLLDRHHGEVIEYLLGPIEAYLVSLLSRDANTSYAEVAVQVMEFFQNIEATQVPVLLEEAIRFLSFSGVIYLSEKVE
jgi:hypothetical protein